MNKSPEGNWRDRNYSTRKRRRESAANCWSYRQWLPQSSPQDKPRRRLRLRPSASSSSARARSKVSTLIMTTESLNVTCTCIWIGSSKAHHHRMRERDRRLIHSYLLQNHSVLQHVVEYTYIYCRITQCYNM